MHPMRLVIDTNVVVSALLFSSGSVTWLRSAWSSDAVLPLASHETTVELIRVLSYPKFCLAEHEREELLMDYLPWCETATVSEPSSVPECRDPHDRPFLELALAGRADALVTGDRDLLVLSSEFSVPILTPKSLRGRLMLPESGD
ncbi:MAG: putative toxin-antitoxin system toxin component, PIN family [Acidimicrobiia bacterium]|nr:putative toxin-antitoxin system toxin component, PIN family [bacterium]MXW69013.1 putative toxin-antitoxin system toxin component, PIN family [Acidimicrobiia bacterium]MDE0673548.1 putative toxin-antitoxin system toxin component, PIN family [bacterium]MXX00313.1 putative toxin-antitoxin system toxin component, PIN family [Acidimicrobiia bacterium]MXX44901.1 putative toxin-antitoxin system toxin component, PIN family [Acidimicrobiia bacterium]